MTVSVEQDQARVRILAGPRPHLALLAPDLALVAACVTLFYCLFLFQGYQQFFRDSDAGWHIRTGETILSTGQLPRTDPYSFTRSGESWFAWEWLSDVVTGAVHRAAGLTGVALLYGFLIASSVWLWFRLHWAVRGNFILAAVMAPLLLTTCSLHWLARPHVVGWLFLLIAVLVTERVRAPFRPVHVLGVAFFAALWANSHASFFLAPLIALIYAAGCWLRQRVWNGDRDWELGRARWFLTAALISAAAPLANPYGWRLYQHVFKYLTDSELLDRIAEFQTFNFHAAGAGQVAATLLLCMAGGVLTLSARRPRPEHFMLALLFSAMALRSARALPLAALVLLPLANGAITGVLEHAGGLAPWFRRKIDGFLLYSARLRALDARGSGLTLVPLIVVACFALLRLPSIHSATGFPPDQFPVAAYPHIPPDARLFAPDKFGGYLIYRSGGTRKVFFDGRSDLYGADFLEQYGRLVQVRPGWQAWWGQFHFTHALLPPDAPLREALQQAGWHTVYSDATAVLLANGGAQ